MNTIKTTIIAMMLLMACNTTNAQSGVSISLHQDLKFATIGDTDRGYKAGTIDIVARFKMAGNQDKYGYVIVFPEFEYAEIEGIYKRYSVNAGYTFNKLILDNFEVNAAIGYGWIDRYGKSMFSFSASSEVAYKITDHIKTSLMLQLTQRKDLLWLYGTNSIKPSVFFGIEYKP